MSKFQTIMNIKENVLNTIKEHNLIKKGDKIVVGVSGGPDSVCLLTFLNNLKKNLKLELIVAHVNYGLRGQMSDNDQKLVERYSKKLELDCKVLSVSGISNKELGNFEENLRNIRYEFFEKTRKSEKADTIAVAHNADDNVETILMFFLRGSGLRGLSGMEYVNGNTVRPLLDVSKKEILEYLKKKKIKFNEDYTNNDTKFIRNRIRHDLIPYLEENYNKNFRKTLIDSSNLIGDDFDFIADATKRALEYISEISKSEIVIDLTGFSNLHIALQRGIIRLVVEKMHGDVQGVSRLDIDETIRIMKEGKGGSRKVIKGLNFVKKSGKIEIKKR